MTQEKWQPLEQSTRLLPSLAQEKRDRDRQYLMELKNENLLFSFYYEAGLNGRMNYKLKDVHWGWDGPLSQIRGTFTGHWLSAAARLFQETGDRQLLEKANFIVSEIGRCQQENGGGWAFPIPEKYLYSLRNGKHFWAPQYVCHKVMMGLLDMYLFAKNDQALEILKGCAGWFLRFTDGISRETMDHMMDIEETGGIMELWGDLYAVTGDEAHLTLMRRYERPKLTGPIEKGQDVLTNMHVNMTVPEIHGCARAYELTGEERYRKIVENYWDLAVTQRRQFATGGQTSGEIYTAKGLQASRLGDMNQEHCVVYNMIRLADYLYRWTGEAKYADYIEQNIYNGLFAQGFWQGESREQCLEPHEPETGLIAYYLPLEAGGQKKWGSKTGDFWCCHCTLVQANARYRDFIYYHKEKEIAVAQYLPSETEIELAGTQVCIRQQQTDLAGDILEISPLPMQYESRPDFWSVDIQITAQSPVRFALRLRLPWWLKGQACFELDGEPLAAHCENGWAFFEREWTDNRLTVVLPKGLTCWRLPDEPDTVAFLDGPVVLAGLVEEQRILHGDIENPSSILKPHDERRWNHWTPRYRTVGQDFGFTLKPLYDIGRERYTVYFPVKKPRD
ncbi:MAG: hypothetical protein HFG27_03840 [Provencibacterium sp.]|jgi:DUF1680 family protein|nr:hypothetical protein [Provencibacterium sp.]